MEQQLKYERALGPGGRSGEDWDCWQAVYGPIGKDGYFQPLFDPETGRDRQERRGLLAGALRPDRLPPEALERDRGKLAGKIHITAGEMDTYYLNNAVHMLDDFLKTTTPPWGGTILYGPRKPHCWTGGLSPVERIKQIAEYAASRAPTSADRAWWK